MTINPYEELIQQNSNVLDVVLPNDTKIKLPIRSGKIIGIFITSTFAFILLYLCLFFYPLGLWGDVLNTLRLAFSFISFIICMMCLVAFFMDDKCGQLQVVAVKITNINTVGNNVYYWFEGAIVNYSRIGTRSWRWGDRVGRLNFSKFKKNTHTILWLDQQRKIAIAAERGIRYGGGAVLLDKDLSYVRLSNQHNKQKFLRALRQEQGNLSASPDRLNNLIYGIHIAEQNDRIRRDKIEECRREFRRGGSSYSGSSGSDYGGGGYSDYGGGDCGGGGGDGGGGGGE